MTHREAAKYFRRSRGVSCLSPHTLFDGHVFHLLFRCECIIVYSLAYFAVPVVSGGFIELFAQLEGDLRVFEGALGADRHLVALLADDHCRLGHITNLPGGKANA